MEWLNVQRIHQAWCVVRQMGRPQRCCISSTIKLNDSMGSIPFRPV
ncbi:hypothetical protein EMIT0P294_40269 [Pseudomonas sp. IT-P294]|jgi:hypothetical protein